MSEIIDAGKMKELLSDKKLQAKERQEIDSAKEISQEARNMLEEFLKSSSGGVKFEEFKAKILGNMSEKKLDANAPARKDLGNTIGTPPLQITPLQTLEPITKTEIQRELFETEEAFIKYLIEVLNTSSLSVYKESYNAKDEEEGVKRFLESEFGIKTNVSVKIENGKVVELKFDTAKDIIALENDSNFKIIHPKEGVKDDRVYLMNHKDGKKSIITGVELIKMIKEVRTESIIDTSNLKGLEGKEAFIKSIIDFLNEKLVPKLDSKSPDLFKESVLSFLATQFGINPKKITLTIENGKISKLEFDPKKDAIKFKSDSSGNIVIPKDIPDYKVFVLTKDGKDVYYTSSDLKKLKPNEKPQKVVDKATASPAPETKLPNEMTLNKPLDITPSFEDGICTSENFLDGILRFANREFNFSSKKEVHSDDGKIVSNSNTGIDKFREYLKKQYGITGNISFEVENGKLVNVGFDELKSLAGKVVVSKDKTKISFPENIPENRLFSMELDGKTIILTSKAVKSLQQESLKSQQEKEKQDNEKSSSDIKTALEGFTLKNPSSKMKDLNAEKFGIWLSYFDSSDIKGGINLPTSISNVEINGKDAKISFNFNDFGPDEEFDSNLQVTLSGVVENNKLKVSKEELIKLFEAQIIAKTIPEIFSKLPEKKGNSQSN